MESWVGWERAEHIGTCRPLKSVRITMIAVMGPGLSAECDTQMLTFGGWQDLGVSWASDNTLSEPHASTKVRMITSYETSGGACEHPESQTGNIRAQRSALKIYSLKVWEMLVRSYVLSGRGGASLVHCCFVVPMSNA